MKIKISSIQKKMGGIYLLLCMMVFMFFCYSKQENINSINVPFIEINIPPLYIVLFISFVFSFIIFFMRRGRVDTICLLLLTRLVLHCIPVFYTDVSDKFDVNFATSFLAFISYFIGLNCLDNKEYICKIIKLLFIIVCMQTICESIIGGISINEAYYYKKNLILPIGGSNFIVSKIIPLWCLIMFNEDRYKWRILYSLVCVISIIVTSSRSGIIVLTIALCMITMWKKKIDIKKNFKLFIAISLALLLIVVLFFHSNILSRFFITNLSTLYSRLVLWKNAYEIFWEHPLLGNGFSVSAVSINPHNFILSILMRSGVVGIVLFIMIFCIVINKIKRNTYDSFVRGGITAVTCIMLQSMVEILIFNYINDIFMWFIIAVMISYSKKNQIEQSY